MKQWTFSHYELGYLISGLALLRKEVDNFEEQDIEEHIKLCDDLQERLTEVQRTIRKEWLDTPEASPYAHRDHAVVLVKDRSKNPYMVAKWGEKKWAVVERDNPTRPVAEKLYDYATHAQRQKRNLNRAALLAEEISPTEVTEYFENL